MHHQSGSQRKVFCAAVRHRILWRSCHPCLGATASRGLWMCSLKQVEFDYTMALDEHVLKLRFSQEGRLLGFTWYVAVKSLLDLLVGWSKAATRQFVRMQHIKSESPTGCSIGSQEYLTDQKSARLAIGLWQRGVTATWRSSLLWLEVRGNSCTPVVSVAGEWYIGRTTPLHTWCLRENAGRQAGHLHQAQIPSSR